MTDQPGTERPYTVVVGVSRTSKSPAALAWAQAQAAANGGRVIADAMADLEERNPAPLVLVCGMLGTKDADGFLAPFAGLAKELIAVPVTGQVAARPAAELAAIASRTGLTASVESSVEAALTSLNRTVWERAPRVLICGSLYLAGEVLKADGSIPD